MNIWVCRFLDASRFRTVKTSNQSFFGTGSIGGKNCEEIHSKKIFLNGWKHISEGTLSTFFWIFWLVDIVNFPWAMCLGKLVQIMYWIYRFLAASSSHVSICWSVSQVLQWSYGRGGLHRLPNSGQALPNQMPTARKIASWGAHLGGSQGAHRPWKKKNKCFCPKNLEKNGTWP